MRSRGGLLAAIGLLLSLPAAAAPPAISIVIDDLGDRRIESEQAIELPGAVACAFLPDAPYTRRLAEQAYRTGKEVLLHLPLQPLNGNAHPLALVTNAPAPEREAALAHMLASVPHLSGVNNHQGSLATASRPAMHWLMRELAARRIGYFIDSYTSAQSVAYPIARAYGLPATRRRVFLDNDMAPAAVAASFDELLRQARLHGSALAIGHPHAATLALLRERLATLAAQGVVLVPPSILIARYEPRPQLQPVQLRISPWNAASAAQGAPAEY